MIKKAKKGELQLKKAMIFISFFLFVLLTACDKEASQNSQDQTDEIGNPVVVLGDGEAPNEILFIFDYSCPYCHDWLLEFEKQIREWAEEGTIQFRAQSIAALNEQSREWAKIEQNIKRLYPSEYYDFLFDLMRNEGESIGKLAAKYHMGNKIFDDPRVDPDDVTDFYKKEYHMESVPAVFVHGKKVEDSFSLEEIQTLMK